MTNKNEPKMKWLIDIIKQRKDTRCKLMRDVNKFMENNNFGNISCPTGAGKSAVVYYDIAQQILNADKKDKFIFVVSTPILRLNEQFTNDMFETLYCAGLIDSDNSICGQLSSDFKAKKGTIKINGDDTNIIKDDAKNVLNTNYKYKFIVACHKSVEHIFTEYKDLINKKDNISFYFDESHTLSIKEIL